MNGLVGQLPELAVEAARLQAGGIRQTQEVVEVEIGVGDVLALAGHPVGQVARIRIAGVEADEVVVVDKGVVDRLAGLHLGLQLLDDVAFLDHVVGDLDAGDLLEGLGQHLRFVGMGRDGFGDDLDVMPL